MEEEVEKEGEEATAASVAPLHLDGVVSAAAWENSISPGRIAKRK